MNIFWIDQIKFSKRLEINRQNTLWKSYLFESNLIQVLHPLSNKQKFNNKIHESLTPTDLKYISRFLFLKEIHLRNMYILNLILLRKLRQNKSGMFPYQFFLWNVDKE